MNTEQAMAAFSPERFWKFVKRTDGGCWIWLGARTNKGYGRFGLGGKARMAHIVAFLSAGGTIPEGNELDHLCRIPACVNPAHLEAVTKTENILRGQSFSAINARKTHCKRGHELTPENIWSSPSNGGRSCRKCARLQGAKWRRKIGIPEKVAKCA